MRTICWRTKRWKDEPCEDCDNGCESSASPAGYLPGSMPEGWGLRRHVPGEIVVTRKDGSGVVIREDADSITEILFYQMMDQILLGR